MGIICCKDKSLRGECIEDHLRVLCDEEEKLKRQIRQHSAGIKETSKKLPIGHFIEKGSRDVSVNFIRIKSVNFISQLNFHIRETFINKSGEVRTQLEDEYMKKMQIIWESLFSLKNSNFNKRVL